MLRARRGPGDRGCLYYVNTGRQRLRGRQNLEQGAVRSTPPLSGG
jgi:hypothetical protein